MENNTTSKTTPNMDEPVKTCSFCGGVLKGSFCGNCGAPAQDPQPKIIPQKSKIALVAPIQSASGTNYERNPLKVLSILCIIASVALFILLRGYQYLTLLAPYYWQFFSPLSLFLYFISSPLVISGLGILLGVLSLTNRYKMWAGLFACYFNNLCFAERPYT